MRMRALFAKERKDHAFQKLTNGKRGGPTFFDHGSKNFGPHGYPPAVVKPS